VFVATGESVDASLGTESGGTMTTLGTVDGRGDHDDSVDGGWQFTTDTARAKAARHEHVGARITIIRPRASTCRNQKMWLKFRYSASSSTLRP
jgi:hypothetical protein